MRPITSTRTRVGGIAAFIALIALVTVGASPAQADPIDTGSASAFGATATLAGQDVIPPTPAVGVDAPTDDASETTIDIPAAPLLINGTLTATASVHEASDIPSALTVVDQATAGPYNAQGVARIENLEVLYEVAGAGVSLVSATAVRAEAAAVCTGSTVAYTANSEIVDLQVGGETLPLNAPVQDIIDAIGGLLGDTGLNAVVDVQRNVVTQIDGGGVAVDALVVTVLAAAGDDPLVQVRLAHAEVGPAECGDDKPECSDGIDNDGDGLIDIDDPECHTDGDPNNPDSYVPDHDDESGGFGGGGGGGGGGGDGGILPRTGGAAAMPLVGGLLLAGSAGAVLVRRLTA